MYGTIAKSRDPALHGRKPVFKTIEELVDSYVEGYIDKTGRIIGYGICSLADLGSYNWRYSKRNLWEV